MYFLKQDKDPERDASVDISPLIDVVFILLLFFIVSTVFVRDVGVDIQKPQALSASELDKNSILLALTNNGDVYFDGREIAGNDVEALLGQLLSQNQRPVIIKADEMAPTHALVELMDKAKLAGADKVFVATENKQ